MTDSPYAHRPWVQRYTPGTPAQLDLTPYRSVVEVFHEAVEKFGDAIAYDSFGATLSYAEVQELSRDFAAYLQNDLGVVKGDRVAMMAPNTFCFVIGMFGILRAGGVQVNVNPMYSPRELKHQLRDADVDVLVIFSGATPTLAEVIEDTGVRHVVVSGLDDLVGLGLPTAPVDSRLTETVAFMDALEAGRKLPLEEPGLQKEDLVFLQYTGGTTGLSKGAMLSHGNILANMLQMQAMDASGVVEDGREIVLTAIPMYHIYALTVNTLYFFKRGAKNVLVTDPRDMPSFVKTWARARPTVFTGVNTLYAGLLHTPGFSDLDLGDLRIANGGGAPVQQAISEKWHALSGIHIKEGYGLSETSPVLTSNLVTEPEYRAGVGVPVIGTDISLRDDAGNEVPQGEAGELCARGPQVMAGYWRQPEATREATTPDGYFKTGDIAVMDEQGYFRIVDRKKDMILVSGFNVFPNEIEETVAALPGVLESACIGVPSNSTGEAVKLFLVRTDDSLTENDVIDYCRQQLAAYKVPRLIEFRDELPKSPVGKILRRELR